MKRRGGNAYNKTIIRTIYGSMGRYIAILSIIALGVGFFAGVKNTKGSMIETCDAYASQLNLYDYKLISTLGFTDDNVEEMAKVQSVENAEGSVTEDFFSMDKKNNEIVLRAHSLPEDINKVSLIDGRMPEKDNECLADGYNYKKRDIGRSIAVSENNDSDTKELFKYREYKIVGIVNSPYYLMKEERGNTTLGDGRISAYIFIPQTGMDFEAYTEMFITCREGGFIFSDEYDQNIKSAKPEIEEKGKALCQTRYDSIVADAQKEIDDGAAELQEGRDELERERAKVNSEFQRSKQTLDNKSMELKDGNAQLNSKYNELMTQRGSVSQNLEQANNALAAMEQQQEPDEAALQQLRQQIGQLSAALAQIDAGLQQISRQQESISAGEAEIKAGYSKYNSGRQKVESKFSDAEEELKEAEEELEDAREKLADIEKPELFIQNRDDNIGIASFESNSEIVNSIAKVFPVFFFLIAALVCSTTMSRMIDEERTQIGALRALGYTKGKIMWKYMVYSGTAALIGCTVGFFAGSKYFPATIWTAYGLMYGFAPLKFYFSKTLAVVSLVVAIVCSAGTTYFACRGQMGSTPAGILRPKAPKNGKRIFLERIGFVWSRLRFLHKVTVRNIFRYKKRMLMMLIGIGGCTALVLVGFGIKDSVAGIANHQYDEIEKYSIVVAFEDEITEAEAEGLKDKYRSEISNLARVQRTTVNSRSNGVMKPCNLMITNDSSIRKAISFKNDGKDVEYPSDSKVLMNKKMAYMMDVTKGQSITVEYDDTKYVDLEVSDTYDNYVYNYMFIDGSTFEEKFKEKFEPSIAFISLRDNVDVYEFSTQINEEEGVIGISLTDDTRKRVDQMMSSLNYIVVLIIGCAGALAFIVLFNLSNINITERQREIATIEVLGFYPSEMYSYVFRENIVLVIMGIIVGMPMGIALHKFIMSEIVVDILDFNEVIEPLSFVATVVIVLIFNLCVDIVMRFKLRKINMVEALKSIE